MTMVQETSLVIFCKRPKPGQGKQRLAKVLPELQVIQVAEALLACALEDARNWPGPVFLCVSDINDLEWAEQSVPGNVQCLVQPSGNLGQKIQAIDHILRTNGYQRLVFIGTDSPCLQLSDLVSVAVSLDQSDIVLSKADDGGVVVMANTRPWPELVNLPWSTDRLGGALADRCESAGYSVNYACSGFDVDELPDLKRLRATLANDARPARHRLWQVVCDSLQFAV